MTAIRDELDALRDARLVARGHRHRNARFRVVPAAIIPARLLRRRDMEGFGYTAEDRAALAQRPRTRGECVDGPRPCPWVGCRYHLALDVNERTGAIKLNFPDLEVDELPVSCALDVADEGGTSLDLVGLLMNLTRERSRQLYDAARAKLRAAAPSTWREWSEDEP